MKIYFNNKALSGALAAFLLLGTTGLQAVLPNGNGQWTGGTSNDITDNSSGGTVNWAPDYPGTSPGNIATIPTTATSPHVIAAPVNPSATFSQIIFTGTDNITFDAGAAASISVGSGGVLNTSGSTRTFFLGVTTGVAPLSILGTASGGGGHVVYDITGTNNHLTLGAGEDTSTGSLADVIIAGPVGLNTNVVTISNPMQLNDVSSSNASDSIVLGGALTLGSSTPSASIIGVISGANGSVNKIGSGVLHFAQTAANTYANGTTFTAGTLELDNATTSLGSGPLTFNGGTLKIDTPRTISGGNVITVTSNGGVLDTGANTVLYNSGLIGGSSANLTKIGTGTLTLSSVLNQPSYTGSLVVAAGNLEGTIAGSIPNGPITVNTGAVLQFHQAGADTYAGNITGGGSVEIGSLTGPIVSNETFTGLGNTYSGGTVVHGGSSLTGNGNNFPQDSVNGITLAGATDTLNFVQTSDNTYGGKISGLGVVNVSGGTNKLFLTADSSGFAGVTNLSSADLQIGAGAKLGGTFNMTGGTLSGNGTIGTAGRTATITGGTVSPGFSIGTLTFAGNLAFTGGTYLVELNGAGNVPGVNNDYIVVAGTATLGVGATVTVVPESILLSGPYTILTAAGGVTGTFDPTVIVANAALLPTLLYDANNVYLDFSGSFLSCAFNAAGLGVAESIVALTTPTVAEAELIAVLTSLSCPELGLAFEALSGIQYTQILSGVELATHQFVRRLYDPLRDFLARDLSCCDYSCCCNTGVEFWVEGGGGQAFFKRQRHGDFDTGPRTIFKANSWQVSGGAQINSPDNTWVLGGAIEYERSNIHMAFGTEGNMKTILGALYGAYRLCDFYFMGDLVFGGTRTRVHRDLFLGDLSFFEQSRPEALEGILYGEFGKNFRFDSFVVAPFIGLEGGYFRFNSFGEFGDAPIALDFKNRNYGTFDTRLGVHLIMDEMSCGTFIGVDLAWQYRCTEQNNFLDASLFGSDTFFRVNGSRLDPNSFEAAINLEQKLGDNFAIFASGYWQQWKNSYAYDALAGVSFIW